MARICKYKPDVLLVEQTVSRVAQQLLLEAGITVVINVKRVSYCETLQKFSNKCALCSIYAQLLVRILRPQVG